MAGPIYPRGGLKFGFCEIAKVKSLFHSFAYVLSLSSPKWVTKKNHSTSPAKLYCAGVLVHPQGHVWSPCPKSKLGKLSMNKIVWLAEGHGFIGTLDHWVSPLFSHWKLHKLNFHVGMHILWKARIPHLCECLIHPFNLKLTLQYISF